MIWSFAVSEQVGTITISYEGSYFTSLIPGVHMASLRGRPHPTRETATNPL